MTFETRLKARAAEIDDCLSGCLRQFEDDRIRAGMGHALTGGKRLRGFLVLETAALFGIGSDRAIWAAAAIEAMHAYSLVHDDLPCMDDDDLRRGQPTVHVKWDEATAVLVGDALQALAFELVTAGDLSAARKLELSSSLAVSAGARGMIRGQALDIAAASAASPLGLDDIQRLQAGKTGALIEWSCAAGPTMAGKDTAALRSYASSLGLAFQIADDLLDASGDERKTGKRLKKDAEAGKATFVSLLGQEGARKRARALVAEAERAICMYDAQADNLRAAARFVISREF